MSVEANTQPAAVRSPTTKRKRLARLITEITAPAPTIVALSLLVAWRSTPTAAEALKWGFLASLFPSIIPFLFILLGVRRRQLTDHHVGVREQRPIPLLIAGASIVIGLSFLASSDAPSEIVALVAVMLAGLLTSLLVTLFWKLSIHTAVMSTALVILVFVFGPSFLALAPVIALIAWARVVIEDHNLAQVIAGAALGLTVAAVVFPLVR